MASSFPSLCELATQTVAKVTLESRDTRLVTRLRWWRDRESNGLPPHIVGNIIRELAAPFERELKLRGGKLSRQDFSFWKEVLRLGFDCSEWCGAPHLEFKGGSACDRNMAAIACTQGLTSISLFCGRQSMSAADLASAREKLQQHGASASDFGAENLGNGIGLGRKRNVGDASRCCMRNLGKDSTITDESLNVISRWRSLRQLSIIGSCISDKGVAKLRHLTNMIFLDLSQSHVTDSGCEVLSRFHHPETSGTEGEKSFRQLKQGREATVGLILLERISLRNTAVTARGVETLHRLPKLKRVEWDGCVANSESESATEDKPALEAVLGEGLVFIIHSHENNTRSFIRSTGSEERGGLKESRESVGPLLRLLTLGVEVPRQFDHEGDHVSRPEDHVSRYGMPEKEKKEAKEAPTHADEGAVTSRLPPAQGRRPQMMKKPLTGRFGGLSVFQMQDAAARLGAKKQRLIPNYR